jgi:hypothetical protein
MRQVREGESSRREKNKALSAYGERGLEPSVVMVVFRFHRKPKYSQGYSIPLRN